MLDVDNFKISIGGLEAYVCETKTGNAMLSIKDVPRDVYESLETLRDQVVRDTNLAIMYSPDAEMDDLWIINRIEGEIDLAHNSVLSLFEELSEALGKASEEDTEKELKIEQDAPPDKPITIKEETTNALNYQSVLTFIIPNQSDRDYVRLMRHSIACFIRAVTAHLIGNNIYPRKRYVAGVNAGQEHFHLRIHPDKILQAVDSVREFVALDPEIDDYKFRLESIDGEEGFTVLMDKVK
jgi:hypothetical protein